MIKATIDYEACGRLGCRKCPARNGCQTRAIIKIDPDEPAAVDQTLCMGCGDCVDDCPARAIVMVEN